MRKIVHICSFDKFIKGFIEFNEKHFKNVQHEYFIIGYSNKYELPDTGNFKVIPCKNIEKVNYLLNLSNAMMAANKIIIHGLFGAKLICFLYLHKKYLRKTSWVMWGADLYKPDAVTLSAKLLSKIQKSVCERFGGIITYIKQDYIYAQKRWGVTGKYYECLIYPSNIFQESITKDEILRDNNHKTEINILVGHSASPSNYHIDAFKVISKVTSPGKTKIFVPFSYGAEKNKDKIIEKGESIFGNNFHPLTNFMSLKEYISLLSEIDIAVFNHKRQQAMSNTINLIGMGKTVYLRSNVSQWEFFKDMGLTVFDVQNFDSKLLTFEQRKKNNTIVKNYFSKENYKSQLNKIYNTNFQAK